MNILKNVLRMINLAAEGVIFIELIFAVAAGLDRLIPADAFFTNAFLWSFLAYICFFNEETIVGKWLKKKKDAEKEAARFAKFENDIERLIEEDKK